MKYEASTLNTKKALAASLKKAMGKKALSRVTVSEITADCGVNRKTFYYHFRDVYDLLEWTLRQEAVTVLEQFDLIAHYEEAIHFVMDYVEANQHILNCAYDSMGRDGLKAFLFSDFISMFRSLADAAEREAGLCAPEDFKLFLCRFYTEALAGNLVDWLQRKSPLDREKTVRYISLIIQNSLLPCLRAGAATALPG
ncbi:MAG: TetR/AcrR family transcriptional regulator C-terminal domain-containing protein [Bacillota bacterium]|nr:TetR/AcrR family transcriptional regulator C-terminal domain-containing protein [Bacillota bacterium]